MRSSGRIGPGASTILMILVVLVMTMLGVLSLFSARSDMEMSKRTAVAAEEYYAAQTDFSLWLQETDQILVNLRAAAGGNGDDYAQLVFNQFGVRVGETLAYRAPVGETRFFCAEVELLPLTEADRYAVSARWLEANDAITFEEDTGWTLIA